MQRSDVTRLRDQIDRIDSDIVRLLSERAGLALEVGRVKGTVGPGVFDPGREHQVLDAALNESRGPLSSPALKRIFVEIISACRALQGSIKVAYLGPQGTFSHQACLDYFGSACELMPQGSIEDIFRQVERRQADFGVVPVENSTEGAVGATLDQFARSLLKTCGETFVHVSHALVSRHRDAAEIKSVFSHPQALAQCRTWLAGNLPRCNMISMQSTAAAAARAREEAGSAAVGNPTLAELFGLEIVARDIQDHALNQTRFLLIGHHHSAPTGRDKTSVIFSTGHVPGALFSGLAPFAEHGINLTRIESRPAKDVPWTYIFFVDFEGHLEDARVGKALDAVKQNVERLKILGSYPIGRLPYEKPDTRQESLSGEESAVQEGDKRRLDQGFQSSNHAVGLTGGNAQRSAVIQNRRA